MEPRAFSRTSNLAGAAIFVLLFFSALAPIQSYDAFWHLATGEWIVANRELPATDPFALASDKVPWHNGEWLFELVLHGIERTAGLAGLSVFRALTVAGLFTSILFLVARGTGFATALAVVALAFAGADHRLGVRPELAGIVFAVVAAHLLLSPLDRRRLALLATITVVWMNMHPSALLAPAMAGLVLAGRWAAGERRRADMIAGAASVAVTLVALLITPWGLAGILSPLRLARIVGSGEFVNAEWLPSRPDQFPALYIAIAAGLALLLLRWRASLTPRLLLFCLFSVLAARFVRNQGYFFALLPLLVAPALPRIGRRPLALAAAGLALAALILVPIGRGWGAGVDAARFPVAAVNQLERSGLQGNIYNPDQFGGYLIWALWPESGVLTDGRNELHLSFLSKLARAREDSRLWSALFREYDLTLAVEEYAEGTMKVIDATTGAAVDVPPVQAYFPRDRWALIGFDDVAMIFARRDAFDPSTLERLEYRNLAPEVPGLRITGAQDLEAAGRELARARAAGAGGARLHRMELLLIRE
ncbi:MAG: hypothetical protein ABR517_12105 [Thermoanaerobaculia bacterium]